MPESIKVLYVECDFRRLPYSGVASVSTDIWKSPVLSIIASFKPDVIVSQGKYPDDLARSALEIRKKWIDVKPDATDEEIQRGIEYCYAHNLWNENKQQPLITVYTPTYNSGDFIEDAFKSLVEQTYTNWEWVVVDDGSTDGTYSRVEAMSRRDIRVRPFSMPHSGKIGELKGVATRLAYGSLLVELDHDDILVDTALAEIERPFRDDSIGMVYANCAEFYDDGRPDNEYKDTFWSGRYRDAAYRGRIYREARCPSIYGAWGQNHWERHSWFLTVGPNHPRAYRKSDLERLGGYNRNLPVADDWDVFFRFFLYSRCYHIDRLLYLQRFTANSATWVRNQSIQEHLALARQHYENQALEGNRTLPWLPSSDFNLTNPFSVIG